MYHEKMLSVAKIENGFLIEIRCEYKVKEKESKKTDEPEPAYAGMRSGEKEIYAKDATDLGQKIEALIPMLDEKFGSESEFDAAFKAMK